MEKVFKLIIIFIFICTAMTPSGSGFSYADTSSGLLKETGLINIFSLPDSLGEVRYRHFADSNSLVIHIQDAHCNYAAQQSLSRIIDHYNRRFGLSVINLEGAEAGYDLSVFTSVKDIPARTRTAEYFVKEGLVNGAELSAIRQPGVYQLWGVEDTHLYVNDLKAYRDFQSASEDLQVVMTWLTGSLERLKQHIYPEELAEFDREYLSYRSGELEFDCYARYLLAAAGKLGIDTNRFKNLAVLEKVLWIEQQTDFDAADNERESLIDRLYGTFSRNEKRSLVGHLVRYAENRTGSLSFHEYLIGRAGETPEGSDKYTELKKYIEYLGWYKRLDHIGLMRELDTLRRTIYDRLSASEEQGELTALSENLEIMRGLFNFTITSEDYSRYSRDPAAFRYSRYLDFISSQNRKAGLRGDAAPAVDLDLFTEQAALFYRLSFDRDKSFLDNLKYQTVYPSGSERYARAAILVTGGFHTENLLRLFRDNHISYVSIIPEFSNDEGYECPYFKILSGRLPDMMDKIAAVMPGISAIQIPSMLSDALGKKIWGEVNLDLFKAAVWVREHMEIGENIEAITRDGADIVFHIGSAEPAAIRMPVNVFFNKVHQDLIDKQMTRPGTVFEDIENIEDIIDKEILPFLAGIGMKDTYALEKISELKGKNREKWGKGWDWIRYAGNVTFDGHTGGQGIRVNARYKDDIQKTTAVILHEIIAGFYGDHLLAQRVEDLYLDRSGYAALPAILADKPHYSDPIWKIPPDARIYFKRDFASRGWKRLFRWGKERDSGEKDAQNDEPENPLEIEPRFSFPKPGYLFPTPLAKPYYGPGEQEHNAPKRIVKVNSRGNPLKRAIGKMLIEDMVPLICAMYNTPEDEDLIRKMRNALISKAASINIPDIAGAGVTLPVLLRQAIPEQTEMMKEAQFLEILEKIDALNDLVLTGIGYYLHATIVEGRLVVIPFLIIDQKDPYHAKDRVGSVKTLYLKQLAFNIRPLTPALQEPDQEHLSILNDYIEPLVYGVLNVKTGGNFISERDPIIQTRFGRRVAERAREVIFAEMGKLRQSKMDRYIRFQEELKQLRLREFDMAKEPRRRRQESLYATRRWEERMMANLTSLSLGPAPYFELLDILIKYAETRDQAAWYTFNMLSADYFGYSTEEGQIIPSRPVKNSDDAEKLFLDITTDSRENFQKRTKRIFDRFSPSLNAGSVTEGYIQQAVRTDPSKTRWSLPQMMVDHRGKAVNGIMGQKLRVMPLPDIHGDINNLREWLSSDVNGDGPGIIIPGDDPMGMEDKLTEKGKRTILVQMGDCVDRGDRPVEVLRYLRYLNEQSADPGGFVRLLLSRCADNGKMAGVLKELTPEKGMTTQDIQNMVLDLTASSPDIHAGFMGLFNEVKLDKDVDTALYDPKIIQLVGNHELIYLTKKDPVRGEEYRQIKGRRDDLYDNDELYDMLREQARKGYTVNGETGRLYMTGSNYALKAAHLIGDMIFIHGGITSENLLFSGLLTEAHSAQDLVDNINAAFYEAVEKNDFSHNMFTASQLGIFTTYFSMNKEEMEKVGSGIFPGLRFRQTVSHDPTIWINQPYYENRDLGVSENGEVRCVDCGLSSAFSDGGKIALVYETDGKVYQLFQISGDATSDAKSIVGTHRVAGSAAGPADDIIGRTIDTKGLMPLTNMTFGPENRYTTGAGAVIDMGNIPVFLATDTWFSRNTIRGDGVVISGPGPGGEEALSIVINQEAPDIKAVLYHEFIAALAIRDVETPLEHEMARSAVLNDMVRPGDGTTGVNNGRYRVVAALKSPWDRLAALFGDLFHDEEISATLMGSRMHPFKEGQFIYKPRDFEKTTSKHVMELMPPSMVVKLTEHKIRQPDFRINMTSGEQGYDPFTDILTLNKRPRNLIRCIGDLIFSHFLFSDIEMSRIGERHMRKLWHGFYGDPSSRVPPADPVIPDALEGYRRLIGAENLCRLKDAPDAVPLNVHFACNIERLICGLPLLTTKRSGASTDDILRYFVRNGIITYSESIRYSRLSARMNAGSPVEPRRTGRIRPVTNDELSEAFFQSKIIDRENAAKRDVSWQEELAIRLEEDPLDVAMWLEDDPEKVLELLDLRHPAGSGVDHLKRMIDEELIAPMKERSAYFRELTGGRSEETPAAEKTPPVESTNVPGDDHADSLSPWLKSDLLTPIGMKVKGLSGISRPVVPIPDIHADLPALRDMLSGLGIIEKGLDFYGTGDVLTEYGRKAVLIQMGDITDRGSYPRESYGYIKFLQDILKADVRRIAGNHEIIYLTKGTPKGEFICDHLNLAGNVLDLDFYNNEEYREELRSDVLSGKLKAAELVGDIIFVHGGITTQFLDMAGLRGRPAQDLVDELNRIFRNAVEKNDYEHCVFNIGAREESFVSGIFTAYFHDEELGSGSMSDTGYRQFVAHDARAFKLNSGELGVSTGGSIVCLDCRLSDGFDFNGKRAVVLENGQALLARPPTPDELAVMRKFTEHEKAAEEAAGDLRQGITDWIITPEPKAVIGPETQYRSRALSMFRRSFKSDTLIRTYEYSAPYGSTIETGFISGAFKQAIYEMSNAGTSKMPRAIAYIPENLFTAAQEILAELEETLPYGELAKNFVLIRENIPDSGIIDQMMHIFLGKALLNYVRYREKDFGENAAFTRGAETRLLNLVKSMALDPDKVTFETVKRMLEGIELFRADAFLERELARYRESRDKTLIAL